MTNSDKRSIDICFIDGYGNRHNFYNEENVNGTEQIQFVADGIRNFLKSLGWSESVIDDIVAAIDEN